MKKKIFLCILLLLTILTTGCFKRDQMEDINIITTIYPIEYVTKRLYGDSSSITSIYPRGIIVEDNKFTSKQLKDFSTNDLFIYNGESNEKEYATKMLNINKNLKIIDASYGLEAKSVACEVWINPSNILMIAQNIKSELENYISNPYIIEEINNQYNLLKVDISEIETELKKTADNSKDKRIITIDESLLFLEKYGFTVINLTENGENKENNIELAKSLLKNNSLSYIFIYENTQNKEKVDSIINLVGGKTATYKIMETISEDNESSNEDYLSLMRENISVLKEETYK